MDKPSPHQNAELNGHRLRVRAGLELKLSLLYPGASIALTPEEAEIYGLDAANTDEEVTQIKRHPNG